MATEIEIKLRVADPPAMRQRLLAAGALPAPPRLEHNTYFDTPDGRLRNADCGLRIRVTQEPDGRSEAILTYKGPRQPGKLKIRQEEEVTLSSAETARRILAGLGYVAVGSFQKRRENFQLGAAVISLDELPELGSFLEIEAASAATVHQLVQALGLSEEPAITASYLGLVLAHLAQAGRDSRRLTF